MARATPQHIPPRNLNEWTVDIAVEYLTRVAGLRDNVALYELTEALLVDRLSMRCRHLLDGKLLGEGIVKPSFWRSELMLELVEGKARVRPIRTALDPGDYEYLLPAQTVQLLWPAKRSKKATEQLKRGSGWKSRRIKTALLDSYPPTGKPPMSEQPGMIERRVAAAWEKRWPDIPVPSPRQIMRVVDSLPD